MKKIVVSFYSFLILFQSFNINLEDISKVNALLQHASYHQEVYGDTFIEFITEHYGENMDSHSKEHKQHDDLPFKDSQHMSSHLNTTFTLFNAFSYPVQTNLFKETALNFFYKELFSSFEKPAFFQPPKIA